MRISPRTLRVALVLLTLALVVLVAALPGPRGLVNAAFDPAPSAGPAAIAAQRDATEKGIQRAYRKGKEQLDTIRSLKVAASPQQIETRLGKAADDLRTLRSNALVALGGVLGATGDVAARYAADAAQRLDAQGDPGADTVLLAPRLAAIVSKMSELSAQITDDAVKELTAPGVPAPTPSQSPRPSSSPAR